MSMMHCNDDNYYYANNCPHLALQVISTRVERVWLSVTMPLRSMEDTAVYTAVGMVQSVARTFRTEKRNSKPKMITSLHIIILGG